jgi:hypothetical protein
MMATYTIVAPAARSCPVKLGAAELWQAGAPSSLELTNTSGKSIRRLSVHAGFFVNTPENLNPVPFEWLWMDKTGVNETRTLNLSDERFRGAAIDNYFSDKTTIGLIFFPGRIEFTDGTIWAPKQAGECFRSYWREPKYNLQFNSLPPFQLDEEEQEDVN